MVLSYLKRFVFMFVSLQKKLKHHHEEISVFTPNSISRFLKWTFLCTVREHSFVLLIMQHVCAVKPALHLQPSKMMQTDTRSQDGTVQSGFSVCVFPFRVWNMCISTFRWRIAPHLFPLSLASVSSSTELLVSFLDVFAFYFVEHIDAAKKKNLWNYILGCSLLAFQLFLMKCSPDTYLNNHV